ncbi:uncharacterized protein PRCAT00001358001 [Priceomyces carsonii]|uniref:uncharacterized protein n=1 Tax=Priceomyces carsonii TaxID=28549 RepID=UPI002ED8D212|nr:unnamed protein product [Priceomyces carsonii]
MRFSFAALLILLSYVHNVSGNVDSKRSDLKIDDHEIVKRNGESSQAFNVKSSGKNDNSDTQGHSNDKDSDSDFTNSQRYVSSQEIFSLLLTTPSPLADGNQYIRKASSSSTEELSTDSTKMSTTLSKNIFAALTFTSESTPSTSETSTTPATSTLSTPSTASSSSTASTASTASATSRTPIASSTSTSSTGSTTLPSSTRSTSLDSPTSPTTVGLTDATSGKGTTEDDTQTSTSNWFTGLIPNLLSSTTSSSSTAHDTESPTATAPTQLSSDDSKGEENDKTSSSNVESASTTYAVPSSTDLLSVLTDASTTSSKSASSVTTSSEETTNTSNEPSTSVVKGTSSYAESSSTNNPFAFLTSVTSSSVPTVEVGSVTSIDSASTGGSETEVEPTTTALSSTSADASTIESGSITSLLTHESTLSLVSSTSALFSSTSETLAQDIDSLSSDFTSTESPSETSFYSSVTAAYQSGDISSEYPSTQLTATTLGSTGLPSVLPTGATDSSLSQSVLIESSDLSNPEVTTSTASLVSASSSSLVTPVLTSIEQSSETSSDLFSSEFIAPLSSILSGESTTASAISEFSTLSPASTMLGQTIAETQSATYSTVVPSSSPEEVSLSSEAVEISTAPTADLTQEPSFSVVSSSQTAISPVSSTFQAESTAASEYQEGTSPSASSYLQVETSQAQDQSSFATASGSISQALTDFSQLESTTQLSESPSQSESGLGGQASASEVAAPSSIASASEVLGTQVTPSPTGGAIESGASATSSPNWLPTSLITQGPEPSKTHGTDQASSASSTLIPTSNLPKAITPATTSAPGKNYELVYVGFKSQLNYPFVALHSLSSAQIFEYLPGVLKYPFDDEDSFKDVTVNRLIPFKAPGISYTITVAETYFPSSAVSALAQFVQNTQSNLYQNTAATQKNLAELIDSRIPLTGLDTGDSSSTSSSTSESNNGSMDSNDQMKFNKGKIAGIAVGAAAGCALYLSLVIMLFKKFKNRSVELPPSDSESRLGGNSSSPSLNESSRFVPILNGSASSGEHSNPRSFPISDPVNASNSLGWSS